MAIQDKALNGDTIMPHRLVSNEILQVLGLTEAPAGFLDIDLNTGLAIVLPAVDKEPIKMRIGKLLKRLKHTDDMQTRVGANARKLSLATKAKLRLTSNGDEVVHVYKHGPRSCMQGNDAVRVYDTEDVAVAYIEVEGRIIARAVVCKNEEIGLHYGNVYGVQDPIIHLLKEQGYTHSYNPLDGCKLVRLKESDETFVMPYIDGSSKVEDHGDYMIVDENGEYGCNSTYGCTEQHHCDNCGDATAEDDLSYSEHSHESLCSACYEDCHVNVDGSWYHRDSDDIIELEDGNYVLVEEAVYVDYRDEWHRQDDCYFNRYTDEYVLKEDVL